MILMMLIMMRLCYFYTKREYKIIKTTFDDSSLFCIEDDTSENCCFLQPRL